MLVTNAIQRMESRRITVESAQQLAWVARVSPTYSVVPKSITANEAKRSHLPVTLP